MKTIACLIFVLLGSASIAQSTETPCNGLPVALPEVKAVCETVDLSTYFKQHLPEKLKTGTHAAVYKITVNCSGEVTQAVYQRGTLSEDLQTVFVDPIKALKWKPAKDKTVAVNSFVYVTLELVNGRFTVVVQ